jgi:hypothetical protein
MDRDTRAFHRFQIAVKPFKIFWFKANAIPQSIELPGSRLASPSPLVPLAMYSINSDGKENQIYYSLKTLHLTNFLLLFCQEYYTVSCSVAELLWY